MLLLLQSLGSWRTHSGLLFPGLYAQSSPTNNSLQRMPVGRSTFVSKTTKVSSLVEKACFSSSSSVGVPRSSTSLGGYSTPLVYHRQVSPPRGGATSSRNFVRLRKGGCCYFGPMEGYTTPYSLVHCFKTRGGKMKHRLISDCREINKFK